MNRKLCVFGFSAIAATCALAACGQNEQQSGQTAASTADPAVQATVAPTVKIRNAYLSNVLDDAGNPGAPVAAVKAGEKAYLGVVVEGQKAESTVKVEWFDAAGTKLGEGETRIPVNGASIAKVEMTAQAPLVPGKYKALVWLNGVPSWEVAYLVN